ncbi:MAG TPA: biotin--[acetyl-CoA-carboxylase] ligase [Chloroflexota bacterium]|nr:biotin--[acetyl-CoA-carboxylase] ligase [Chloroflexota bacterium]
MSESTIFSAPAGWALHYFPETGSTNDLARDAGEAGAPERTIFVTDHQTMGRGRQGRSWLEVPGSGLLFSILFRRHQSQSFLLTSLCSVAACEAIDRLAGVHTEIKWPNDLMLSGRKLSGVLTEVSWAPGNPFAVVGMGINVNFNPTALDGVPDNAISLLMASGREIPRAGLLNEILRQIDLLIDMEPSKTEAVVRSRWVERLWRRKQRVVIAEGGKALDGVFEDVAEDGALLLRLEDGSLQTVRVGDLVI